jgi:hypothetical protein
MSTPDLSLSTPLTLPGLHFFIQTLELIVNMYKIGIFWWGYIGSKDEIEEPDTQ